MKVFIERVLATWNTITKVNAILVKTNNPANIRPYRVVCIEISLKNSLLFEKTC